MHYRRNLLTTLMVTIAMLVQWSPAIAQSDETGERHLLLKAKSPSVERLEFRLLPSEAQQEEGNAVPVLLRMTYEQSAFMANEYPKLADYAELPITDPKLSEIAYDSFAKQAIRAGNMSFADWEYPLDSQKPYLILLPDVQSQRQLIGRGMTVWVKQRLAKGDTRSALKGIRAQLACARHISQTPIVVCNLVGVAIASEALSNLELTLQNSNTPNLYWSLAVLPDTLVEVGPMVRWESQMLLQSLPSLTDPLPPVGDAKWKAIADEFIGVMSEISDARFTQAEAEVAMSNIDSLAAKLLLQDQGWSEEQLAKASVQERIMRWVLIQHSRFATAMEASVRLPLVEAIQQKKLLDAQHAAIMEETKAKASPFSPMQSNGIVACHRFGRQVRFLQTMEAIRDHVAKHDGKLPKTLAELELPAPNDPFTGKPFLYMTEGDEAVLRWEAIAELKYPARQYHLRFN